MNQASAGLKQALSRAHGVVYDKVNKTSTQLLLKHGAKVPLWLTADAVTTGRLTLLFPTAVLISRDYHLLPATLVMVNAALDYVDGALARWEREDPARSLAIRLSRSVPTDAGVIFNKRRSALTKTWGAYYDALADKAYAIPVWCSICAVNPDAPWLQAAALSHVAVESISAYYRTKSYYANPFAGSVVTANATGKVKQMVSMAGTALALIPATQLTGGVLLWVSLPLSFASLADKLRAKEATRVLVCASNPLSPKVVNILFDVRSKYEVIACLKEKDPAVDSILKCSDAFDGVITLNKGRLDQTEFDRLGATFVYLASKEDMEMVDPALEERGLVKIM